MHSAVLLGGSAMWVGFAGFLLLGLVAGGLLWYCEHVAAQHRGAH